jgi:hypothetical protein
MGSRPLFVTLAAAVAPHPRPVAVGRLQQGVDRREAILAVDAYQVLPDTSPDRGVASRG